MNHRKTTILAAKALGVSGTEIIELNVKDNIAQLHFTTVVTTGAAQKIASPLAAITKIELLDGSTKLLELKGTTMQAVQFYDSGQIGTKYLHNTTSANHTENSCVMFGRFPYDPLYNFDPKAFKNPQIRVTWNVALCEVNATAFNLKVIADCFDEKITTPVGFMRDNTVYVYTPTAAAYAYVDLPTDLDIRKLMIQFEQPGAKLELLLADCKLSEDNDKRVPFDMSVAEFLEMDSDLYPDIKQTAYFMTSAGGHWIFAAPSFNAGGSYMNITGVRAVQMTNFNGNRFSCGTANATDVVRAILTGEIPWQTVCWPFGDPYDPEDWYKVQSIGNLRLRILGGASAGVNTVGSVVLQQVYKY